MGVNNVSEKSDKRISFALIFGCIINNGRKFYSLCQIKF